MIGTFRKTIGILLIFPFSVFFFALGIIVNIPTQSAGLAGIYAPIGFIFVIFSILIALLGVWLIKNHKKIS